MSQQHDEKRLVTLEQVISRRDDMFGQYQLIYNGIETLVSSQWLSTSMASPTRVYDRLKLINKTLKDSHQMILLEGFKDVYALETSYLLYYNLTLSIFCICHQVLLYKN